MSKLLVTTDNLLMGVLLKNAQVLGQTDGVKDIRIDGTLPFWSSTFGKFIIWYARFDLSTRIAFQNTLLLAFGAIIFGYFVIKIYKKAIATPLLSHTAAQNGPLLTNSLKRLKLRD